MAHWKKLMDPKEFLFAHDLDGRDVTVTIEKVVGGKLKGENGKESKKPIAHIKGTPKKLALNVTNCKTIEQLSGTGDADKWRDIRVTLFPTTTDFGGKTVDCIRIRPSHPKAGTNSTGNGNGKRSDEPPPSKPAADPDADLLDDNTSDEGSDAAV